MIDTPMDFGTICSNLESGVKYSNSEDVFKDVQYIWDNCFKYNSKGDYILDLMRRVKKNFTKYWTAAGLYSGQPLGAVGENFMVMPFWLSPLLMCSFLTKLSRIRCFMCQQIVDHLLMVFLYCSEDPTLFML